MLGRFLTQDPIRHEGGLNLYGYCEDNPLKATDPSGHQSAIQTFAQDWSWGKYGSDSWQVIRGEGSALNPINWVKSLWGLGTYISENGVTIETAKTVGGKFIDGINIFNKEDPYEFGQSMMNLELALAPLGKKIPNPTSIELTSLYGNASSFTLFAVKDLANAEPMRFRFDLGNVPDKPTVSSWARGKWLPHYHRRGPGGIGAHHPYQNGW